MDRYKIDQLKKGKEAAEKYFPQLSGGATPPVSKSRNLMDEYQTWKRRKEERERMFPSLTKTVSKQTETQKMIADYEKTHKNRNQTISAGKKVYESIPVTYGKGELTRKRNHATIIPQADPEYEKYVEKGAKDPLVGMGDTKLQSFVRTALDRQPMEEMSQEEKGNYNYVLGKYGRRTADEYLKSLEERLNKQWMDKEKEKTREFSKEHPLLGTAMDAIAPMVAYEPYIAGVAAQVTGSDLEPPCLYSGNRRRVYQRGSKRRSWQRAGERFPGRYWTLYGPEPGAYPAGACGRRFKRRPFRGLIRLYGRKRAGRNRRAGTSSGSRSGSCREPGRIFKPGKP